MDMLYICMYVCIYITNNGYNGSNNGYFMRPMASQGQKPTMGMVSIPAKNDDELGDCL